MTLTDIQRRLAAAGIEDAAWEARLLAAHYTGLSDARLLLMGREELEAPGLEAAVARRETREPLQYILGEWSFMGLSFSVNSHCLIPRPDTETLVEYAIRHLPKNARAADLCTGSGCIGIALAHYRPDVTVTAVDLFPETAKMAEENARRLGVSDRFTVQVGDVTEEIFSPDERFAAIVSNPPYITLEEMKDLAPELSYEPRAALTDEGDGLSVIRGVLAAASRHLEDDGLLLMEFGAAQGEAVSRLAREYSFYDVHILKDAAGRDRVLCARRGAF
ncbi:MAG: peptide chain release factor N(5)-glutamine methyltransferase [Clostridia bacterium]|nr:peptide chain release factor N(5)-glutamine methyltransferase [Clostridia bacterium]